MSEPKNKKKKGNAPSKEEAALAMDMIKVLQEKGDIDSAKKKEQEEEERKRQLLEAAEKARIQLAQEQIEKEGLTWLRASHSRP